MTTIYVVMRDALLVVRGGIDGWQVDVQLQGKSPRSLAYDPLHSKEIYCGTEGYGVWHSGDGGATWYIAWDGVAYDVVTAVAVSGWQQADEGVVYAGTEPSGTTISMLATHVAEPGVFYAANNHGLFRSADAGLIWTQLDIPWSEAYRSQRVEAIVVKE